MILHKKKDIKIDNGVEFGWKIHSAITDWIAKVDTKASIMLSLGGVALGFFITLYANHIFVIGLYGWRAFFRNIGVALFCIGIILAASVVTPHLRKRNSKKEWAKNYIYFGHLRHWKPEDLKNKLINISTDDAATVLSEQLVSISKVAWFKHNLLRAAMIFYATGILLVFVALAFPRF